RRFEWDLAWCQLLELLNDAEAHDAWKALITAQSENAQLMWEALQRASVRKDRELTGKVLERIKTLNGDTGLNWRMEKAQWLLGAATRESQEEAVTVMTQAVTGAPKSLEARILLAQAYAITKNLAGAIAVLSDAMEKWPDDMELKMSTAELYHHQHDV